MSEGQRRRRRSNQAFLQPKEEEEEEEEEVEEEEEEEEVAAPYVPEEIVLRIITRLPVKSLLRFRCVSKQWSSFVAEITTRVQKYLVPFHNYHEQYSEQCDGYVSFGSIDNQSIQEEEIDIVMEKSTTCNIGQSCCARIRGFCNGLLLIGLCDNLCLWNPLIRCCISYWPSSFNPNLKTISGLSFDTRNDSYKFVVAWSNKSYWPRPSGKALVGNFKTRLVETVEFPYGIESFEQGPVLNNHPHWWHRSSRHSRDFHSCVITVHSCHIIVYFDSETDEFVDLPVPSVSEDTVDWLGVLDGCLCMARYLPRSAVTKVLLMKEYGVKESWTLFFKFEQNFGKCYYVAPLLFLRNGTKREVLMVVRKFGDENSIVAYDIDNHVYNGKVAGGIGDNFLDPVVLEETVIRRSWSSNAISASKEEETMTEERTRPKIVWNVKDEIIRKNEIKELRKKRKETRCSSSVDVEEIARRYLEQQDRVWPSNTKKRRAWGF